MKKITLLICLFAMSLGNAQYTKMGITGDGVGGWPDSPGYPTTEDINQMTSTDGINWTLENLVVGNGSFKFRADYTWDHNWGSAGNPGGFSPLTGTAVSNSGTNLALPVGIYNVTFNSTTLAYSFTISNIYPTISLVGTAVSGTDVFDADFDLGTTDGIHYSANGVHLYPAAVKWRQNHTWSATTNWGPENSADLVGTAVLDAQTAVSIAVEANYNVTFNLQTLAYTFTFPTIAIVGNATTAGWPLNTPGEIDPLVLDTDDGVNYYLTSIALTAGGNAFKFRADNAWTVQWGASTTPEFPSGIGTQSGGDINPDVAGNYSLAFNRQTGVYTFALLGLEQFQQSDVKAYPNPTRNNWNVSANGQTIEKIRVTDFSGKVVMEMHPNTSEAAIDASGLSTGMYFANVSTATGSKIIKVVKQ
ncbi:T9SS type A sorting domain-containing protein [Flavobacterium silvaticum]|uniref:T9SS type A sorting domain-containing protein n=1 Tax=Flavobacterium silvaticum TaxID=1852020 RepID=A0A972FKV9_9FLAO|nr:T9SS type A sorting domain-containing protein [Flavobacterium silvaticum]NMH27542.1 T9SS type A sorting domain-containing protein [Flavobacterium silvaticum]